MLLFFCFFFLSGFCSLVYQVVWLRASMADFGVTTALVSIVVSVFMAGLALGSWAGGKLASGVEKRSAGFLLSLYGVTELLIGVSGIGPKLAMNILSGISPQELLRSLDRRDVDRLLSVPGIGRKMAERMLLDLQEKARKLGSRWALPPQEKAILEGVAEDVLSALLNLGYKRGQAEKAVESVFQQNPDLSLEKALKASLKILATI